MSGICVSVATNDPALVQPLLTAMGKDENLTIIPPVSIKDISSKKLTSEPDVLLLEPSALKDNTVGRFIRSLQAKNPKTKIVYIMTQTLTDERLIADIKSGIKGYVKITDAPALVAKAIQAVNHGGLWAERRILEKSIHKPMLMVESLQAHTGGLPPLTGREIEMLNLVLEGASNREIADRSSISERTVKTHLYRVYRKLNVKSRTKAIALLSNS